VAAEAAEALVAAAQLLIQASRHLDALRLLERAVALGCRQPSALLDLAKLQALSSRDEDSLTTLALIEDDADDPALAVERDHTAATSIMFSDPSSAFGGLQRASQRWHDLGNTVKEAWARANAGVAFFNLSRMEESAVELEQALTLFQQCADRAGTIAVSSFLSLVKPTDERVSGWLAEALEFADAAGDRSKQLNTLTTLTWNHFLRSLCGRAEDMAEAERFGHRLAELAEDLGAPDQAVQGWSLLAIMARLSGRLDEATELAVTIQRVAGMARRDPWLGWAACFTVAGGASGTEPPSPPSSPDPVVRMSRLIIEAELTMAGRVDEALAREGTSPRPDLGPVSDLAQVFEALALVLVGRADEARPLVERAAAAARVLNAASTATAATALRAEITGDTTGLPPPPTTARGLTDVLVLRAYATHGDAAALETLRGATEALAMPGLMMGT
jgi:tetratricopeptide (TPR) repeat protein